MYRPPMQQGGPPGRIPPGMPPGYGAPPPQHGGHNMPHGMPPARGLPPGMPPGYGGPRPQGGMMPPPQHMGGMHGPPMPNYGQAGPSYPGGGMAGPSVVSLPTTSLVPGNDYGTHPKAPAEAKVELGEDGKPKKKKKPKPNRMAAGRRWHDAELEKFEKDDFRIFCGDLGNEVSDEGLARGFAKYPSVLTARVVRDKRTGKSRGYGFVSFKDPEDFMKAMREMNGKYIGNRPIKLRKSTWKDRDTKVVKKKEKNKKNNFGSQSSTLLYEGKQNMPKFS